MNIPARILFEVYKRGGSCCKDIICGIKKEGRVSNIPTKILFEVQKEGGRYIHKSHLLFEVENYWGSSIKIIPAKIIFEV